MKDTGSKTCMGKVTSLQLTIGRFGIIQFYSGNCLLDFNVTNQSFFFVKKENEK